MHNVFGDHDFGRCSLLGRLSREKYPAAEKRLDAAIANVTCEGTLSLTGYDADVRWRRKGTRVQTELTYIKKAPGLLGYPAVHIRTRCDEYGFDLRLDTDDDQWRLEDVRVYDKPAGPLERWRRVNRCLSHFGLSDAPLATKLPGDLEPTR